jgi:MFS family permease
MPGSETGAAKRRDGHGLALGLRLALFGVALSALWSPLNSLLLPELVADTVSPAIRGTSVGLLTVLGIGAAVVIQPVAGVVSDHWPYSERRRPFILVGALIAAAATLLLAFAPSFSVLLVAYVIVQCGANVAQAAFQALIPDHVAERQRGQASGSKTGLSVLGNVLGLGIAAGLASLGAPAPLTVALLGILVGASVTSLLFVPPTPAAERGPRTSDLAGAFKPLWRAPAAFRVALGMRFLYLLGIYPFQRFLVFFLEDSFGVEEPGLVVGATIVAGIAAGGVGALGAGPLADLIGARRVLVGTITITAVALACAAFGTALWFVLAAGVVLGFATGAFQAASWAVLTKSVPGGEEAQYLGVANMATAGAGAAAGLLGPAIDGLRAVVPALAYPVTFGFAALIAALSLLPALRVKAGEESGDSNSASTSPAKPRAA